MTLHRALLAFLSIVMVGCGEQIPENSPATEAPVAEATRTSGSAPADAGSTAPSAVPRKIIYTAQVDLVVEDFDRAAEAIERLVGEQGGYLAASDVQGSPGSPRRGSWTARIPVDRFGSFLAAVAALGELIRRHSDAQDVTEEYTDLEARIQNKRVEESRLVRLLEEQTGELKDVLDVERELSRVREEIERQQGRLQFLANRTSLTTVTLTVSERSRYVPPEQAGFGTRIARTFRASVEDVILFGEGLVLMVVGAAPWIPLVAAIALPVVALIRHRARHRPASP